MAKKILTMFDRIATIDSNNEFIANIIEEFDIKKGNYNSKYNSFVGCTFKGFVNLEGVNIKSGLSFESCIFKNIICFENIISHYIDHVINPKTTIYFNDCIFEDMVIIKGDKSELFNGITFNQCTFKSAFEIDNIIITEDGITIDDCTLEESNSSKIKSFKISRTTSGFLRLYNNRIDSFCQFEMFSAENTYITHNTFNSLVFLKDLNSNANIDIQSNIFNSEVELQQISSKYLSIADSNFIKSININNTNNPRVTQNNIENYSIRGSKFQNGIYIGETKIPDRKQPIVKNFIIEASNNLNGEIYIKNLHIGVFNIRGYNANANIILEDLCINQFYINKFINKSSLIITRVQQSTIQWLWDDSDRIRVNLFSISESNLGEAQFYENNFSQFERVHLQNAILANISATSTTWFNPEQMDYINETEVTKALKNARKEKHKENISSNVKQLKVLYQGHREIFRQLKYVYEKQGDTPTSLFFKHKEMMYYGKYIKLEKYQKINEHLILWSSKSNNFGLSWLKAFGLLMLFSFIFYIPIGFLTSEKLDYSKVATSLIDVKTNLRVILYDNIKNWFVILNPTHKLSEINENIYKYSGWLYFWDFISRVIVAYFIFQIITAFRKYTK